MRIKLVVFDMAGTTVEDNNNVAAILQSALEAYGVFTSISTINTFMGYPKDVAIRKIIEKEGMPQEYTAMIDKIHNRFIEDMISFYRSSLDVKEKEHASYVFTALRKSNIKVAIDTGFSRDIADIIIGRLGWKEGEHYDISITSDEVQNGRPYPDMIHKAMAYCAVEDAREVAKVGDTVSDLQQGDHAGCGYVIGVTSGSYSEADLKNAPHSFLIHDLKELLPILNINP